MVTERGFHQIVTDPITVASTNSTLIDHFVVNNYCMDCLVVSSPQISYNFIINVDLHLVAEVAEKYEFIVRRSYHQYDKEMFQNIILKQAGITVPQILTILQHDDLIVL